MTDIPQVGQAAPDFTAQDQNGDRLSLNDKKGRWIVRTVRRATPRRR